MSTAFATAAAGTRRREEIRRGTATGFEAGGVENVNPLGLDESVGYNGCNAAPKFGKGRLRFMPQFMPQGAPEDIGMDSGESEMNPSEMMRMMYSLMNVLASNQNSNQEDMLEDL